MIKTVELFAGVGGFRIGLEKANEKTGKNVYNVIWSNQWEPSTKTQHASQIYENKWGSDGHINSDIESIEIDNIPDHDLLVGGFPCQDYSVATTLKNSKGLIGKKGVLWWSINRILAEKKNKPKYLIFENVDRLLSSPSTQRGRDFAVMLKCLDDLGYAVEWRIINAADYGFPQRRRRVFFIGYHKSSKLYNKINTDLLDDWVLKSGIIAKTFAVSNQFLSQSSFGLADDIKSVSDNFGKHTKVSPFMNTGILFNGKIFTGKTTPQYDGNKIVLRDILLPTEQIPEEYFISDSDLDKWKYLKGPKREVRKSTSGFEYNYAEGGMIFPDSVNEASRTIITGEGGKSPSRFKHVIATEKGFRRLVPIELERLNMFPDNHTMFPNISDAKRAFLMGNALVVGIVEGLAETLAREID